MKPFVIKGGTVLVDDSFYDVLEKRNHKWYVDNSGYAVCWLPRLRIFLRMHNLVVDYIGDLDVDHIDRNHLNNQANNLRLVEHHVNLHNAKLRTDNTNGFKGVFRNTAGNWGYQTWIKGKKFTKQGFHSKEEAYRAKTNFLDQKGITIT